MMVVAGPGQKSKTGVEAASKGCKSLIAVRLFAFACFMLPLTSLAQTKTIVALGDSNTAGLWVARQQAFPARLEAILRSRGLDVRVINAGVPGDTFEGMWRRIDASVPSGAALVIIQGGYNDLVDRVPPAQIVASLNGILARLRGRRVPTILCGFFDRQWNAISRRLAAHYHAQLVPGSTCYDPRHTGLDRLHMTAVGHEIVARRLAGVIERKIGRRQAAP